jgi:hypothetical protein
MGNDRLNANSFGENQVKIRVPQAHHFQHGRSFNNPAIDFVILNISQ